MKERKEPRRNKKFMVKGGNVSKRERNYDCEAFGKRKEEGKGKPECCHQAWIKECHCSEARTMS